MKKFNDYIINILSSVIPVIVLQIVIYPTLSSSISKEMFGELLFIVTFITIIATIFGNTLNNIRLVNKDNEMNNKGSYNLILVFSLIISSVILNIFFLIFNFEILKGNYLLANIWLIAFLLKTYLLVEFRLRIDFKKVLVASIFGVIGYLIGLIIYFDIDNIIYIFAFTELFALAYIIIKTKYNIFNFEDSLNLKTILSDYFKLFSANLISNVTNYFDRFLLLFILGSIFVTEFFVATFIAKSLVIILYPITNVILTYSVGTENTKTRKEFNQLWITTIIVVFTCYFIIVGLSYMMIPILYEEIFNDIVGYLWVTNLAVLLFSSTKVIQTLIISKGLYNANFKLNLITFIVLLISSVPLTNEYGLIGYSISLIIASVYKYIHIFIISRYEY